MISKVSMKKSMEKWRFGILSAACNRKKVAIPQESRKREYSLYQCL